MREQATARKIVTDIELQKHLMFYRNLLDSLPEGVIIADGDLNIISVNEPSETILNISRRKNRRRAYLKVLA